MLDDKLPSLLMDICPACFKRLRCFYCVKCPVGNSNPKCLWHNCEHMNRIADSILSGSAGSLFNDFELCFDGAIIVYHFYK